MGGSDTQRFALPVSPVSVVISGGDAWCLWAGRFMFSCSVTVIAGGRVSMIGVESWPRMTVHRSVSAALFLALATSAVESARSVTIVEVNLFGISGHSTCATGRQRRALGALVSRPATVVANLSSSSRTFTDSMFEIIAVVAAFQGDKGSDRSNRLADWNLSHLYDDHGARLA